MLRRLLRSVLLYDPSDWNPRETYQQEPERSRSSGCPKDREWQWDGERVCTELGTGISESDSRAGSCGNKQ